LTNREAIQCRYCLDPKGLVPWARDEGRECARCRAFCHWLSQDSSDPKKCKQQFAEDIKSGARRKKFLEEELPEYQKLADGNGGRAPSRKSQKKGRGGPEDAIYLQCFLLSVCIFVILLCSVPCSYVVSLCVVVVHCTQHITKGRRISSR